MTAAELIASRITPLWSEAATITGHALADAAATFGRRYRKADGTSLTQFNTGGLVIREDSILALTECQPLARPSTLQLRPPTKSRLAVIEDIRCNGPPLLAVLFAKGAFDLHRWACSTPDEVVLNGVAGPEEIVAMEDVALLRGLPGSPREWRRMASLCAQAQAALDQAAIFHEQAAKLANKLGMERAEVMRLAHHLRDATGLTFDLAAEEA